MDLPPAAHQAAGHAGCLAQGAVFAKPSSPQEIDFYSQMAPLRPLHPPAAHLSHWMPTFMGLLTPQTPAALPYIVLHNLYHRMSRPCVLDIKLGAVLVDHLAPPEKRARMAQVSADTTSGLLHFRVCGMKVFCPNGSDPTFPAVAACPDLANSVSTLLLADGSYYSFDKTYGRRLTCASVNQGIDGFFAGLRHKHWLYVRFHQRLQLLYNCLLDAEVRIKSGLLLFVYDADPSRWDGLTEEAYYDADPLLADPLCADDDEDEDDDENKHEDDENKHEDDENKHKDDDENKHKDDHDADTRPLSSLHLIDFAHAKITPGKGPDENIIVGIENLLLVFETLIAG